MMDELMKNIKDVMKDEYPEDRMELIEKILLEVESRWSVERHREFMQYRLSNFPKVDLDERRRLVFGNSTLQDDIDFMGADSNEAKALEECINYLIDANTSNALVVILSEVIHPLIERNRILAQTIATMQKKEETA